MNANASQVTLVMALTARLMDRVMESTAILMLTARRVLLILHINAYAEKGGEGTELYVRTLTSAYPQQPSVT